MLRFRGRMRGSLSGNLATMGPGVPYGIGAKFGCPDRPVIVFAGDGAMQMNGLAELITIKRYWAGVGRPAAGRRGAAQRRPQPGHLGDAGDGGRAEVRRVARPCPTSTTPGSPRAWACMAIAVDKPDEVGPAWDRALAADRPTVLDVRTDPNVPPMPPHATTDQMNCAAKAMLHGDEDRWEVMQQGVKTKLQEFLPHREG